MDLSVMCYVTHTLICVWRITRKNSARLGLIFSSLAWLGLTWSNTRFAHHYCSHTIKQLSITIMIDISIKAMPMTLHTKLIFTCSFISSFFLQPLRDDPDRIMVGRKQTGMEGCISIYSLRDRFAPPEGKQRK